MSTSKEEHGKGLLVEKAKPKQTRIIFVAQSKTAVMPVVGFAPFQGLLQPSLSTQVELRRRLRLDSFSLKRSTVYD